MKTRVIGVLALMSLISVKADNANGVYANRSFLSVRPFADSVMSQDLVLDMEHQAGSVEKKKSVQFTVFGSQSTESDALARYFFQGRKSLRVGDGAPQTVQQELAQEILVNDFNISTGQATDYASELFIKPRQTVVGGSFSLRMYCPKRQDYFMAVEVPVVSVKNDLRLTEVVSGTPTVTTTTTLINGNQSVNNMIEAFKQPGMAYGKIDGAQKKNGVGDVVVKIGYEPAKMQSDTMYGNFYLGAVLPTSNKPKAVYMFEPMLGNNKHAGLVMGTQGYSLLRECKKNRMWVSWNVQSQYLFTNTQKRSFDLVDNGTWSRYLPMFVNDAQLAANVVDFGINIMTLDARVRPGYRCQVGGALTVAGDKWHAKVGATTFAQQGEKIHLSEAFLQRPYLASYDHLYTNHFRQSGKDFSNLSSANMGTQDVAITESDISLKSAAHPGSITQVFYASLGGYKEGDKPRMYELGASYEFSCLNTALNRWGVWGTLQLSF